MQARNHFERQDTLLSQGWTTRANHEQAKQAFQTAQANLDRAEAQLKSARDLVSFTELKADAPGVVTAVGRAQARWCRPDRRSSGSRVRER